MQVNIQDASEKGTIKIYGRKDISNSRFIEITKTMLEQQVDVKVPDEFQEDWNNFWNKAIKAVKDLYDVTKIMETLCKKRENIYQNKNKVSQLETEIKKLNSQVEQEQEELKRLFEAQKKD